MERIFRLIGVSNWLSCNSKFKLKGEYTQVHIQKIQIKNYRLLNNVTIDFDKTLTLFVGKNNTGKTSLISIFEFLLSDQKKLSFEDYPLSCRETLYNAVNVYWNSTDEKKDEIFQHTVPTTSFTLYIDYSEDSETFGALSNFIIDLDDASNTVIISITLDVISNIGEILTNYKTKFDTLMSLPDHPEEGICISELVQNAFPDLFELRIVTVNPSNPKDTMVCSKNDLKSLFCAHTIKAERSLDESNDSELNPLGKIMRKLFETEISEVTDEVRPALESLQKIVTDVNYNIQNQVTVHMNKIVSSMRPFGYPDGEDLALKAKTKISLEKRITDNTELAYESPGIGETPPGSHNGLGYKNLIKISMELHEYVQRVKEDRTKIPVLIIEEPEAHMHPQLQTTFVEFLEDFIATEIGENVVQCILTTHSAHVANTIPFNQIRYIRRYKTYVEYKNLSDFPTSGANDEEKKLHLDFLQKYMKTSYCDLYFCDKAILVEGATERLLIPDMIRKLEQDGEMGENMLSSQYYTIAEVGGAYAHLFYDFVDYLGVPTLIITDIDFVNEDGKACQKDEAKRTSNGAIIRWCHDVFHIAITNKIPIERVLEMAGDEVKRTNGLRRLVYQKEEGNFHPRSLEEAIINVNRALFGKTIDETIDFSEENDKKTDFAIRLLYEHRYADYQIPSYIKEGLVWLSSMSRFSAGEEPVTMHRRQYRRH